MQDFLNEFGHPAYRHLLINHLPLIGLATGCLALFLGFFLRNRAAQIPGLIVILVMAASAYPVYRTGVDAYKSVRRVADEAGVDWLDLHYDRADAGIRAFYVLAAIALVALVLPVKWPRTGTPLAVVTLVAALACIGVGGWIAQAAGPVMHVELRPSSPPSTDATSLPTVP